MIRLAIVGTGGMANAHATNYAQIKGVKLVAGVDVNAERAKAFCEKHKIPHAYTSVEELLKNCAFDAASVVTPDAFHVSCALPLVKAGKHVLCEKPLAPTASEAKKLVDAAKKNGVINMVNFSYRNSCALQYARELVSSGKLGRIMHFEAHYLQTWLTSPIWGDWRTGEGWLWRLSTKHGSKGVLGDVGVHITDLATFAANDTVKTVNGSLKVFHKAKGDKIGQYILDANDSSYMRVELAGGGVGTICASRWASGQPNSLALVLYGDKGGLRLDLDKSYSELEVCLGKDLLKAKWKTLKCKATPNMYARFIKSIKTGKNDQPHFSRGWEVQRVLDATIKSDATGKTVTL